MTEKFTTALRKAQTSEQIIEAINDIAEYVGMPRYTYWTVNMPGRHLKDGWSYSTNSEKGVAEYLAMGFHMTDPVVINAPKHMAPFAWGTEEYLAGLNDEEMKIFTHAAQYGVKMGILTPVHGPGAEFAALSVMAEKDETEKEFLKKFHERSMFLGAIAPHIQEALRVVLNADEIANTAAKLTAREIECISWIADGKSYADIAEILKISRNTVITHVNRAKEKLGVNTSYQAVAVVMQSGMGHHDDSHPY